MLVKWPVVLEWSCRDISVCFTDVFCCLFNISLAQASALMYILGLIAFAHIPFFEFTLKRLLYVSHPNKLFPVCCHMLLLPSLLEADDVVLYMGLLRCVLWLGLCSADVSNASSVLEPDMQQNWKQRFIASSAVTYSCDLVFPLRLSMIYFNLILLKSSVIQ